MAVAVARGDVLARGRVADVALAEAVHEVARADDLRAAVGRGELLAGLAGARELRAVALVEADRGSVAVGRVARRGAERLARERRVLRRDAGVDDADDGALARVLLAARLRPDAVGAGEAEEVGRGGGGGVVDPVGLDAQDLAVARELRGLLGGEVGREAVDREGVRVVDVGADAGGDILLLSLEVVRVRRDGGGSRVELRARAGLGGGESGDAALVGRGGLVGEGHDVAAVLQVGRLLRDGRRRGGERAPRSERDEAGGDEGGGGDGGRRPAQA
ncbi:hypothetical protein ABID70_001819 [Clavibacter michiganensis]